MLYTCNPFGSGGQAVLTKLFHPLRVSPGNMRLS